MADFVSLLFSRSARRRYSKDPNSRKCHEDLKRRKVRPAERVNGRIKFAGIISNKLAVKQLSVCWWQLKRTVTGVLPAR